MTSDMQNPSPSQNPDNAGDTPKTSGLPVRGLAMILIAVAVLLAAWALWSLNSDGDDSAATGADTTQTQDAATPATQGGDAGTTDATTDAGAADGGPDQQDRQDANTADGEADANPAGGTPAESTVAQRPAGGTDQRIPVTTLHVLNNSTVPQLAARVADSLDPDYDKVESGNLADIAIPETTVYFTKGNADAEKAARELADRVGGIAMERTDTLPEETAGDDAIVLVLTEDIAL